VWPNTQLRPKAEIGTVMTPLLAACVLNKRPNGASCLLAPPVSVKIVLRALPSGSCAHLRWREPPPLASSRIGESPCRPPGADCQLAAHRSKVTPRCAVEQASARTEFGCQCNSNSRARAVDRCAARRRRLVHPPLRPPTPIAALQRRKSSMASSMSGNASNGSRVSLACVLICVWPPGGAGGGPRRRAR
jgi:hypothetical protein